MGLGDATGVLVGRVSAKEWGGAGGGGWVS